MKKLFLPIIDNGMGLSRTSWSMSLAYACLTVLRGYDVTLRSISYPYPDGAANIAANDFLASWCDEMLLIDTDIIFSPQQVEWILSHDEEMVFGIYPKKRVGLTFPHEWMTDENPFVVNPLAEGVAPLVELKRTARGFMKMRRSVLEKMRVTSTIAEMEGGKGYEFFRNLPGGHSDDFAFCDRWRAFGGKILVDQRIVAQHEGSAVYPIPGTF